MDTLDIREWLLTNGLGSYANGTISDAHTRTYHGWLIAALNPPVQRRLLLARIDASFDDGRRRYDLGTNYWKSGDISPMGYRLLQSFQRYPTPTWIWGGDDWSITRRLLLPYAWHDDGTANRPIDPVTRHVDDSVSEPDSPIMGRQRLMIHYHYQGNRSAILNLRPLIADRSLHYQQSADDDLQFSQVVGDRRVVLQAIRPHQAGTTWTLRWTGGAYYPTGVWYWNYHYPEETQRGLGDREDLYSPGYLVVPLEPGASVTLEASLDDGSGPSLNDHDFEDVLAAESRRLHRYWQQVQPLNAPASLDHSLSGSNSLPTGPTSEPLEFPESPDITTLQRLLQAGDQFVVYRQSVSSPTLLAGYPWFGDWGRDALIALPGLTLTTGRFTLAKGMLRTFARYCNYGLIPNTFPDSRGRPFYNCLDASLWWIETLGLYLNATQDWDFLIEQYVTVQRIYKALTIGTLHNIRVDAMDGLLTWDAPQVALTWMDAICEGQPVTPRRGKPIEINALWYSSLCWANRWALWLQTNTDMPGLDRQASRYQQQAERVAESLQKFWNPGQGYFNDVIGPDDRPDEHIRPNAVIALSLSHCSVADKYGRAALLLARDRLLTPYGLRSLDPKDPGYAGRYAGDVPYRDQVYHQGTVWTWLLGPFIRAWQRFLPEEPLPVDATALLSHFESEGGIGSISELFDGASPHQAQGAIAQAWSVAELIRHWPDLESDLESEVKK